MSSIDFSHVDASMYLTANAKSTICSQTSAFYWNRKAQTETQTEHLMFNFSQLKLWCSDSLMTCANRWFKMFRWFSKWLKTHNLRWLFNCIPKRPLLDLNDLFGSNDHKSLNKCAEVFYSLPDWNIWCVTFMMSPLVFSRILCLSDICAVPGLWPRSLKSLCQTPGRSEKCL